MEVQYWFWLLGALIGPQLPASPEDLRQVRLSGLQLLHRRRRLPAGGSVLLLPAEAQQAAGESHFIPCVANDNRRKVLLLVVVLHNAVILVMDGLVLSQSDIDIWYWSDINCSSHSNSAEGDSFLTREAAFINSLHERMPRPSCAIGLISWLVNIGQ